MAKRLESKGPFEFIALGEDACVRSRVGDNPEAYSVNERSVTLGTRVVEGLVLSPAGNSAVPR